MSERKKYYWMVWSRSSIITGGYMNNSTEAVTDRHPFLVMRDVTDGGKIKNTVLDNWKEITLKEYNLYKSIFYKLPTP